MKVLGIPVRFGGDALVLSILILSIGGGSLVQRIGWVAAILPVVLVHELGHALEARRAGGEPQITLGLLGGQTSGIPANISHTRSLWISAAGVVYSLAFLAVVGAIYLAFSQELVGVAPGWLLQFLLLMVVFNGIWALVQLLPIGRFDGSHMLESLLRILGVGPVHQIMIGVMIVTGLTVAWFGRSFGYFALIFLLYYSMGGLTSQFQQLRDESDEAHGWREQMDGLVSQGRFDESIELATVVGVEAKSDRYRAWARDQHLRLLFESQRYDEAVLLIDDYPEHPFNPRLVGAVYIGADDLSRFLAYVSQREGRPAAEALKDQPDMLHWILTLIAKSAGFPQPAWEIVKSAIPGLGWFEFHSIRWTAKLAESAWVLSALSASPEPPLPDSVVGTQVASLRDGDSGSARALAELTGDANPQIRQAVLIELYESGRIDAVRNARLPDNSHWVRSLNEMQTLAHREAIDDVALELSAQILALPDISEAERSVTLHNAACTLARQGRLDEAVDRLELLPAGYLPQALSDPELLGVADHPRVMALRMKLSETGTTTRGVEP